MGLVIFTALGHVNTSRAEVDKLILISLDGVRTQELFQGLDEELLMKGKDGQKKEDQKLYKMFHGSTPEESRSKLMPFFWNQWVPNHGVVIGNRHRENATPMKLVNRRRFSYPGYSEIVTGQAHDKEIKSNDKIQNPFPTLLDFVKDEWNLGVTDIGCFATWDVFPYIVTSRGGSITANAGFDAYPFPTVSAKIRTLDQAQFEQPTPWDSVRHDFTTFHFTMEFLKTRTPRFLYLALGETDDWAHMDRYDRVLETLHRTDRYFESLWDFVQSSPEYRNRTAIIICTDHGRGDNIYNWMSHNDKLPGAEFVWMAAFSPDISLRGEWDPSETVTQSQIAATLAAMGGLNFLKLNPEAGKPIKELLPQSSR